MSLLYRLDLAVRQIFYNQLTNDLKAETRNCRSLLDLGCGFNPEMKKVNETIPRSVGVDAFIPSIEKAKEAGTHSEFETADVIEYLIRQPDNSFDAVIAQSLIEHYEKEKGKKLLSEMERVAVKKIILLTPNGFVKQKPYDNNPWQEHKSGWSWKEMKSLGYEKIYGLSGIKWIRGERAMYQFKPRFFWKAISYLTQVFSHGYSRYAFEILCIKTKAQ